MYRVYEWSCFTISGELVGWWSLKWKCIATSSAESEYNALSECVQMSRYYWCVLKDFGEATVLVIVFEHSHAWYIVGSRGREKIQALSHILSYMSGKSL